jgi:hypothetical protein
MPDLSDISALENAGPHTCVHAPHMRRYAEGTPWEIDGDKWDLLARLILDGALRHVTAQFVE